MGIWYPHVSNSLPYTLTTRSYSEQGAGALCDTVSNSSTSVFVGTLENGRHIGKTLAGLCVQRPSTAAPADQTGPAGSEAFHMGGCE